jgi:hypothetical protein
MASRLRMVKRSASMAEKPFDATLDTKARVITIQGIRYAFDLFDALGFAEEGTVFRIGKRHDGVVTLHTVALTNGESKC